MKRSMAYSPIRKCLLSATIACIALVGCDQLSDPADDPPNGDSTNLIANGDFSEQMAHWNYWIMTEQGVQAQVDTSDGTFMLDITTGINREYGIGLAQRLSLERNTNYRLSFDARATEDNTVISAGLDEDGTDVNGNGEIYGNWNRRWLNLSQGMRRYSFTLVMPPDYDDPTGRLAFWFDFLEAPHTITVDNIVLEKLTSSPAEQPPEPEMLRNGNFSEDFNFWWWWADEGHVQIPDCTAGTFVLANLHPGTPRGEMCIKARAPGLMQTGQEYRVTLSASSTVAGDQLGIELAEGGTDLNGDTHNYSELATASVSLTTGTTEYEARLVSPYTSNTMDMNIFFTGTRGTIILDSISMKPVP